MSIFNLPLLLSSLSAAAVAGTLGVTTAAVDPAPVPAPALIDASGHPSHDGDAERRRGKRRGHAAHPGRGHARGHMKGHTKSHDARKGARGLCAKIECTDDQRARLQEIRKDLRTDVKPEREAMKDIRTKLAAEFSKDSPNARTMKRLTRALNGHKAKVSDMTHEALMDAHAVLTPEQRSKLAASIARRGPRGALSAGGRKGGKSKAQRGKGKGKKNRRNDG